MKMILGIGALVLVVAGIVVWGVMEGDGGGTAFDPAKTTYFYGAECPHCQKVNEFLEANKVADKVNFEKKEVWHNRAYANQMREAANVCKLDAKSIAVPFVFSEGKCTIGEPQVIQFFKEKAGV